MNRRSLLASVAALTATLVLAAAALAVTQKASSSGVTATFSYTVTKHHGRIPSFSGEHLTIARDGTTAYSGAVTDPACVGCAPFNVYTGKKSSVSVANLTGAPGVVLALYTGGAHCCVIGQAFIYSSGTGAFVKIRHDFADPGFTLKPIGPNGQSLFVSADPDFEYEFDSFAQSGFPLQIWGIENGAFTDVTRSYPALIKTDAARWYKLYEQNYKSGGEGLFAAWAADEELLGKDALVQSTLKSQAAAGHFVNNDPGPNGTKFISALNKVLVKRGYETLGSSFCGQYPAAC